MCYGSDVTDEHFASFSEESTKLAFVFAHNGILRERASIGGAVAPLVYHSDSGLLDVEDQYEIY